MANFSEQATNAGHTAEDNTVQYFEQSLPDEILTDRQGFRNDNFQPAPQHYGWSGRVESQAHEVALTRDNVQYAPRLSRGKQAIYANPQNAPNEPLPQNNHPSTMGWAEQEVTSRQTTEHTSQTGRAERQQNYTGRMEVSVNQQNTQQTVQKANCNPALISQAYTSTFTNGGITMETAPQDDDSSDACWKDLEGLIDTENQSTRQQKHIYPYIDLTNDEEESKKAFSPATIVLKKPVFDAVIPQGMTPCNQERMTVSDITRTTRIYEDSSTVKNSQSTIAPVSQVSTTAHTEIRKRKAFIEPRDNGKIPKSAKNAAYNASNFEGAFQGFLEDSPQKNYQRYPNGGQFNQMRNVDQNATHVQQPSQNASCGGNLYQNVAADDLSTNSMCTATPSMSVQSYPDSFQRTQQMQPATRGEHNQGPAVLPAIRIQREAQPISAQEITAADERAAPSRSHAQPLTRAILTDNPLYYPPPDNTQSQTPTLHVNLSIQHQPTYQGPLTQATPAHQSQLTFGAQTETSSHATYSQTTNASFMGTRTYGYSGQGSTWTQQQNWSQQFAPIAVPNRNESEVADNARLQSFSSNSNLVTDYHRLMKILAVDNGYGLIRQNRMKCGDDRCSMQHMVPDVLEKDAKDVLWHTPVCRYFSAKFPCKHCVKWNGECIGCHHCSQSATGRTF